MASKGLARWTEADGLRRLVWWSRAGRGMRYVAEQMGVTEAQLRRLRARSAAVDAALTEGEEAKYRLADSMYRLAFGEKVKVRKHHKVKRTGKDAETGERTEYEELVEVEDEIYVQPSVMAAAKLMELAGEPDEQMEREMRKLKVFAGLLDEVGKGMRGDGVLEETEGV